MSTPAPPTADPPTRRPDRVVEALLRWLFGYPLLFGQIALYLAIAWGVVGGELGLTDLFWHDAWWVQVGVGAAVCWLFGVVLFLNYLLHGPARLPGLPSDPPGGSRRRWFGSLFVSRNPGVRVVGRRVTYWLLALLVVAYGGKQVARWVGGTAGLPGEGLPFVAGYLLSFLFAYLLSVVDHLLRFRERIADNGWVRRPFDEQNLPVPAAAGLVVPAQEIAQEAVKAAGARRPAPPPEPAEGAAANNLRTLLLLHAMALFIGGVTLLMLATVVAAAAAGGRLPPIVIASVLFIGADVVVGYIAFRFRSHRTIGVLAVAALFLLNSGPCGRSRMTFPHLPGYQDDPGREADFNEVVSDFEAYTRWQPADGKLIDGDELLATFHEKWDPDGKKGTKPRLVLVATSGGGIRAAVWTAVVLEGFEEDGRLASAGFRRHIRLFAGASGGMVGAGAYAAAFDPAALPGPGSHDRATGLGPLSAALARDSLSPTVQTMLLRDFTVTTLLPVAVETDRGRTLEDAWDRNFTDGRRRDERDDPPRAWAASPLARPVRELAAAEARCERPSLVFSPMLVEDSKRLLVSNLDLAGLTAPRAPRVGDPSPRLGTPAVEFFRLYPDATAFRVGTAARMSATFPVVSPAVRLPGRPTRRVVDAGYFDNYGVDVLAGWLTAHRKAVLEHTSGVLVVQVRGYPLDVEGTHFRDADPSPVGKLVAAVSAPLEALTNARGGAAHHRDDGQLDALARGFNGVDGRPADFFATAVFELNQSAALSWYLTNAERRQVAEGFYERAGDGWRVRREVRAKLDAVAAWFGDGGR